ncbi:MAG: hypothetical protein QOI35_849 [Cryptosporangiaceae bacterium]|jgi:uncharacterized protein YjbJ (UPF0337 family)|nr:hypothetical protein [Cryptosporangiaceae bacterium]MDQ1651649.1 hypothetical protein [Cryptosporangiaceae bacterium]
MRLVPRIEYKNLSGVVDKVVGLTREVAGIALDHDSLIRSGEAQQVKGTERLKQLRTESKARQHRDNARAAGTRQRQAARSNA